MQRSAVSWSSRLFAPSKCMVTSKRSRSLEYPPKLHKRWQLHGATTARIILPRLCLQIISSQWKSAIYWFVSSRENRLVDSGNVGKLFRYANRKLCSKSTIEPLYNKDGAVTTNPKEKASKLQHIFVWNFSAAERQTVICLSEMITNNRPANLVVYYSLPRFVRLIIKKL